MTFAQVFFMSDLICVATLPHADSRKWNPHVWLWNQGLGADEFQVFDLKLDELEKLRFDILHVHWFEGYVGFRNPFRLITRFRRLLRAIDWQRGRGAKLVYTAHNVIGHETQGNRLEMWFLRQFMRRVDGTIFVSKVSEPMVREVFPELTGPSTTIPLSDYDGWYPNTVTRAEARARFGIPDGAKVISHVGLIRRYKNVAELIKVFAEVPGEARLLIGGRVPEAALQQEIEALAASDPRVILRLGHLDDADMQDFLNAADLVVLPYRQILNSGSAMLALTFGRPVLVPNLGSMPELQASISPDWVRVFDGELSSAELELALGWAADDRSEQPPLDNVSVATVSSMYADFYRSLVGR